MKRWLPIIIMLLAALLLFTSCDTKADKLKSHYDATARLVPSWVASEASSWSYELANRLGEDEPSRSDDYLYMIGFMQGYRLGHDGGIDSGYESGYEQGYNEGYNTGYDDGYDSGIYSDY
jgi:flagellar biosynthesis/type III secretory pathway protein FliH